LFDSVRKKFYG
jgi:hypothetical protein